MIDPGLAAEESEVSSAYLNCLGLTALGVRKIQHAHSAG